MEFIFEFFLELVVEIFGEAFFSAGTEFAEVKSKLAKKKERVTIVVIIITLILLICLFVGSVMLLETKGESDLGKVLVGFPVVYFITGIILKISRFVKKEKGCK